MVIAYIKNKLQNSVLNEKSPDKLAISFAVGVFITFSPYIGFHNIMIFLCSWLFKLNPVMTFFAGHIVNPLTMVPVLTGQYIFGTKLLNMLGIKIAFANPGWVEFINVYLVKYLGISKICLWTFFAGANISAIILALAAYPLMKLVFAGIIKEQYINLKN